MKIIAIFTVAVMTFWGKLNFFSKMCNYKNTLKLFICGFAIVGLAACGGGGGGGIGNGDDPGTNTPINITGNVNSNDLDTYSLQNLSDTDFFSDVETEITGNTNIDQITITISNNSDTTSVTVSIDSWETAEIDITSLVNNQNDAETELTITITYFTGSTAIEIETIAHLTITVVIPDTTPLQTQTLSFDQSIYTATAQGETIQPTASGEGTGAISYTIANIAIASIIDPSTGEITPLTAGQTTITATIAADNIYDTATATADLIVALGNQTLAFDQSSYTAIALGETIQTTASGEGTGDISYAIADATIATIDPNTGEITPLTAGQTIITATIAADSIYDATTATAQLSVALAQQNFVFVGTYTVTAQGNTVQAIINSEGSGAISYTIADATIATIDTSGIITPLIAGQTIITATIVADDIYATATTSVQLNIIDGLGQPQTLTFDQSSYDATAQGETIQTTATGDGTGNISYSIADIGIASINANTGEITPLTAGQTAITANIAADSTYDVTTATAPLTVYFNVQSIVFDATTYTIAINNTTVQVTATGGKGSGATSYTIANTAIATIDANTGVITPLTVGQTTITATIAADDAYNTATATAQLNVALAQQTLTFDQINYDTTAQGDTIQATASAEGSGTISYAIANSAIATIDASSGVITPLMAGQTTIAATIATDSTYDTTTATAQLTVNFRIENIVLDVSIYTLVLGSTVQVITTSDATGEFTYAIADTGVATINANGVITPITVGQTTITVNRAADSVYAAATTSVQLTIYIAAVSNVTNIDNVLTWDAVAGATSYEIQSTSTDSTTYTLIVEQNVSEGTSYAPIFYSQSLTYRIRACTVEGCGDFDSILFDANNTLPTGLSIVLRELSWAPVAGAVDYEIQRAPYDATSYISISTQSTTNLALDFSIQSLTYRIRACNDGCGPFNAITLPNGDFAKGFLTQPSGMWSDGSTIWIADAVDDKIYAYNLANKARDASQDFDTFAASNSNPRGIWSDGTTMWVADSGNDEKIYAYNFATKARDASQDFDTLSDANNDSPHGIWSDGITMWVANNQNNKKIYAYNLATKARVVEQDFPLDFFPRGIWSDGTTMWATNIEEALAYNLATKLPDEDQDFNINKDNSDPYFFDYLWSDGNTLWLMRSASGVDDEIYAYDLATKAYSGGPANGDFDTLSAANIYPNGLWSDGITIWVTNFDTNLYAYSLFTKERETGNDFTLNALNNDAGGLWSDGTTMWVADRSDQKIYAYDFESKERLSSQDINSLGFFPAGIWSDGTTMWVVDTQGDVLRAYDLATQQPDADKDIVLTSLHTDNPRGLWGDGTSIWVSEQGDDRLYAYFIETGERDAIRDFDRPDDANTMPTGIWSNGTTMWVVDETENKIFAYDFETKDPAP